MYQSYVIVQLLHVPRLVPYNKLSLMLNEINVGTLYSVRDNLCHDLETGEQVEGCYRNLSEKFVSSQKNVNRFTYLH